MKFQEQIAGPNSRQNKPALTTSGTVSEVLGPGRLSAIYTLLIQIRWGAGTTKGEVTIEASDDPDYTGTWESLTVIAWASANKIDEQKYSGNYIAVRCRSTSDIDGAGAIVTAAGNRA